MEGFSNRGRDHPVTRRVHIVYFLSRNGKVEQPHLIRIHHIYLCGVHLRDVKRWLSELRGPEMPNSFAWSYKRRYKNGYIWQDLTDGDLITPISDNEYVLMGSHIPPSPSQSLTSSSYGEKTRPSPPPKTQQHQVEADDFRYASPKPPPHLDDDSPEDPHSGEIACVSGESKKKWTPAPASAPKREGRQLKDCEGSSSPQPYGRSKSYSSGRASHVLRSVLLCRAVETDDAALFSVDRRRLEEKRRRSVGFRPLPEKIRSSRLSSSFGGKSSGEVEQQKGETRAAAYRPLKEPKCSQCGKVFKPEKLHSHMKSCRALKSRRKSPSMESPAQRTASASHQTENNNL